MEFITKNINSAAVENHLQMLEKNIIYFAQSVRFSDEAFGQASGVAMKFKIFALESKAMTCERKFIKALRRMFLVLSGYYDKKGVEYDPFDFEFEFVRNFPLNLMEEAQTLATLKGNVSDETALGQMSFIKDPLEEMDKMKKEQEELMQYQMELDKALQPEVEPGAEIPVEQPAEETEEIPEEVPPGQPMEPE
jgi:SPP1 family phage portal protein